MIDNRCTCSKSAANSLLQVAILFGSRATRIAKRLSKHAVAVFAVIYKKLSASDAPSPQKSWTASDLAIERTARKTTGAAPPALSSSGRIPRHAPLGLTAARIGLLR
jgi:hypothetical protein